MNKLKELMRKDVLKISQDEDIINAVKLMNEKNVGAALVINNNKVEGIFTERDILKKVLPRLGESGLEKKCVKEFMTKNPVMASSTLSPSDVASLMKTSHFRHIPVEEKGEVIGILSQRILMWHHQEELEKLNDELKKLQMQLIHTARMSAMGEMSAGVAHELNQPLMALSVQIETFFSNPIINSDDKLKERMQKMKTQFTRLNTIVRRLNTFSKSRIASKAEENINTPITDSLFLFEQQLKDHNIQLKMKLVEELPKVALDRYEIQDVVINFLCNAKDAIDDVFKQAVGGEMTVFSLAVPQENCLAAGIIDNGKPVQDGTEKKIFDIFFTTKGPEKGTGLGLAVCCNIIKDHKGIINFIKLDDKRKMFYFILPVNQDDNLSGDDDRRSRIELKLKDLSQQLLA
ncbi:MAG: CBS domain-containing protein [Candidatus Omnitrophica bacterium]|nr:CBS domain-containing protein [Candidatus Omnitrophota bacterium]